MISAPKLNSMKCTIQDDGRQERVQVEKSLANTCNYCETLYGRGPLLGTSIDIEVLGWCRSQPAMFTRPGLGTHLPSEPCYVEEMPFISTVCLVLH